MRTFHESKYKYMGIVSYKNEKRHAFHNIVFKNGETVLLEEAKLIKKDGTSIYYNPIANDESDCGPYMTIEELFQTIKKEYDERVYNMQNTTQ